MEQAMTRPRSLLEEKPLRLHKGGKIRPGIQVLKSAARNEKSVQIYDQGVAEGLSFDEIEKRLMSQLKLAKSPLVPQNVPYFTARRGDFDHPENADRILELYGEERPGVAGRRIYRFPVVFGFDDWLQNLGHGFKAFGSSGIKFWSEYDSMGDRYCMTHKAADVNPQNQRAIRRWGTRKTEVRANEHNGRCLPEMCAEYQNKECGLSGGLVFYIPGIPGSSIIEMPTTSIYSLQQMRSQMELVAGVRNGRLSGTHMGRPLFRLTKTSEMVSRIEEGRPTRVRQYLVYLEADLEMVELMAAGERALMAPAARAALAAPEIAFTDGEMIIDNVQPQETERQKKLRLRAAIAEILAKRSIDAESFGIDVAKQYGAKWSWETDLLEQVLSDLHTAGGPTGEDGKPLPF